MAGELVEGRAGSVVVADVPDVWLEDEPGFATADAVREAYVTQLLRRVAASGSWAP